MSAQLDALFHIISLGAAVAMTDRKDSDNVTSRIPQYEISVQMYSTLPWPDVHLRSGLRLGLEGAPDESRLFSPEVKENSTRGTMETGVVLDGPLIPAAAIQALVLRRTLELDTRGTATILTPQSKRSEWLFGAAVQIGLGIPIEEGRFLIEPFFRLLMIPGDTRQTSQWGGELSWAIGELK